MAADPLEQTMPPGTCPMHAGLVQAFRDLKEVNERDHERMELQIERAVEDLGEHLDTAVQRIEARLEEGEKKFAHQNGEITRLKGWRGAVTAVLAAALALTPIVLSLWAIFKD